MKKQLLWFVALISSTLFAATDAQIVEHFKSTIQVPNITIEVVSRKGVEGIHRWIVLVKMLFEYRRIIIN
jgi:thiol:disulfide interchange protein DsbC